LEDDRVVGCLNKTEKGMERYANGKGQKTIEFDEV
jgi:hypothetical protein